MGNLFDSLGSGVFDLCKSTFGYTATWQPSAGGTTRTATVLLGTPTADAALQKAEFDPETPWIEYKEGDLPGLYDAVREGKTETINVNSNSYYVRSVSRHFDGKCFKAFIENV